MRIFTNKCSHYLGRPITVCFAPSLTNFPSIGFDSSDVSLIDDGRVSSLQARYQALLHLSPPGDRWCHVLGFVPMVVFHIPITVLH